MKPATVRALAEIASFRPCAPLLIPEPALPISDTQVAAWVSEHPFLRAHLAPAVARSLAFIDTFKRRQG